jgi:hypothetical protein
MISDQLLEEAGVLGEASVSEWPLFFVPLADDVLSLELDDAVSDLYMVCLLEPDVARSATDSFVEEGSHFHLPGGQSFDVTAAAAWSLPAYHW